MSNQNGNQSRRGGGTATILTPDRGGAMTGRGEKWMGKASNYYNLPLVKKAHWKWQIVLYFFLGGIAGGSYLVTTLADFLGLNRDKTLIRSGRYLSFACVLVSPILLIWDLGRPERFYNMLRILKLRSVMSIGSWALTAFGICCGFTTAHQMAEDGLLNWLPWLARLMKALPVKLIEAVGSFFGIVVASYTGVLLSSTAVPVWARAKYLLGPLFLTSAVSTGLSALSFILSLGRPNTETLERLDQAEMIAMTTELGLIASLPATLGSLSNPLFTGRTGWLFNIGTIGCGLVLPLLTKLGFKLSRASAPSSINTVASLFVLLGGLILRYVWIAAGRRSADDPQAVHQYNRMEWEEQHE